jgi:C-terminal processing protease CtpA/Prc
MGQRILAIAGRTIAEIQQAEGLGPALGPATIGVSRTFSIRRPDSSEFTVAVSKARVTIDPVPFVTTFTEGADVIGYLDMRTFVATADAELEAAFADFVGASVNALVIDLRYNGGGLVVTAERLADLIGGFIAAGRVQSQTRFNSAKSHLDSVDLFQQRASSLDLLQQVVFITTGSSASASELVINALEPHTVVGLVGTPTFGKPVGQSGLAFCSNEFLLRAVTFETVNSLGAGQYYDGLDVDCAAGDELERELGDPLEASLAAALGLIQTGSCPVAAAAAKPTAAAPGLVDVPLGAAASAARRHAGAY